jgi:integrase
MAIAPLLAGPGHEPALSLLERFNPSTTDSEDAMPTTNAKNPSRGSRRSAKSELLYRLTQLLREHNHRHSRFAKRCSDATATARGQILRQGFLALHELGYKLRDPAGFGNRHMQVLARHWEEQRLSAAEIQRRFSVFRVFATWVGKDGMVAPAGQYLADPAAADRSYVAQKPKGWSGLGIDVEQKLAEIARVDRLVALQLALQRVFGLRAREAWLLHPKLADQGTHLAVNWGAKGGRDRTVPIENPAQRQILDIAKCWANTSTGSLIPDAQSLKAWKTHFYRVCRDCGIARTTGIVAHGLRHEEANAIYKSIVGVDAPVYGGDTASVDPADERLARQIVAEHLGHSRPQIAGAYLGSLLRSRKRSRSAPSAAPTADDAPSPAEAPTSIAAGDLGQGLGQKIG